MTRFPQSQQFYPPAPRFINASNNKLDTIPQPRLNAATKVEPSSHKLRARQIWVTVFVVSLTVMRRNSRNVVVRMLKLQTVERQEGDVWGLFEGRTLVVEGVDGFL